MENSVDGMTGDDRKRMGDDVGNTFLKPGKRRKIASIESPLSPPGPASVEESPSLGAPPVLEVPPSPGTPPTKRRKATSARTGQACDRCKSRKIKCDSNPAGCGQCRQLNQRCSVTDRNSNRTIARGYVDKLEEDLKSQRATYEQQIRDLHHGYEQRIAALEQQAGLTPTVEAKRRQTVQRARTETPWLYEEGSREPSTSTLAQEDTYHAPVPNMNGARSTPLPLSLLNGTTLSLNFMEIDVAEFSDVHGDLLSSSTFESFFQFTSGRVMIRPPPLPPTWEKTKWYAELYFKTLNAYTPFLERKDYFEILTRAVDKDNKVPLRPAEDVMVHMLFAEMKYQIGSRNDQAQITEEGLRHYRYSLTKMPELLSSRTIVDVQALLLIAFRMRGFPKPGAACHCVMEILSIARELNLHRAAHRLPLDRQKALTDHDKEMRKRIFWSIYALQTSLCGKTGQVPMFRFTDADIELPLSLPDSPPGQPEEGPPEVREEIRSCSYTVGIEVLKLMSIVGQMYEGLMGTHRTKQFYASEVIRLEAELQKWKDGLPWELTMPVRVTRQWKSFAIYTRMFELECRFLLRHPVIHYPTNPEMFTENAASSLQIADELRTAVRQLHDLKVLDIIWMNVTTFLSAMFTTLYIHDKRPARLTESEVSKLENDMAEWLQLLHDIGPVLGSGSSLARATKVVVDSALEQIRNKPLPMQSKSQSQSQMQAITPNTQTIHTEAPQQAIMPVYNTTQGYPMPLSNDTPNQQMLLSPSRHSAATAYPQVIPLTPHTSVQQIPPTYNEATTTQMTSLQPNSPSTTTTYDPQLYPPHQIPLQPLQQPQQQPLTQLGYPPQNIPRPQHNPANLYSIPTTTNDMQYYTQPPGSAQAYSMMGWTAATLRPVSYDHTADYSQPASALLALGRDTSAETMYVGSGGDAGAHGGQGFAAMAGGDAQGLLGGGVGVMGWPMHHLGDVGGQDK